MNEKYRAIVILCTSRIDGVVNGGDVSGMTVHYIDSPDKLRSLRLGNDVLIRRTLSYKDSDQFELTESTIKERDRREGKIEFINSDGVLYPVFGAKTDIKRSIDDEYVSKGYTITIELDLVFGMTVKALVQHLTLYTKTGAIVLKGTNPVYAE